MSLPLVSAIIPCIDARRVSLVRKAINSLLASNYDPLEILVINGVGGNILTNDVLSGEPGKVSHVVKEIPVSGFANASTMRNAGIRAAAGDWVLPVDDDDWQHPHRVEYQMARRRHGRPCLLRYMLQVDLSEFSGTTTANFDRRVKTRPFIALKNEEQGIPSTLLFPRKKESGELWLYDESLDKQEHYDLLERMQLDGLDSVVCQNQNSDFVPNQCRPLMQIAFFHSENVLSFEEFFGVKNRPDSRNFPDGLTATDAEQLKTVLEGYQFVVT
tara:strand:+ start:13331 stop:14146 length:816 start_codon:yes stop_codon:yes gene_type:complete